MDEQSPNESQPKVRRAGSGGAEEPRPSATRAGHTGQAEHPENASEKPLRAGESQVESVPQGPFQAIQHALEEWTHFFGRAVERNSRAASDLRTCYASVLQWQRDLLRSNAEDWLQTSFAVFGVFVRKVPHAQAASETAAI